MLWRMLRQSWGRNLRRKVLAIITVFLASSLISALLALAAASSAWLWQRYTGFSDQPIAGLHLYYPSRKQHSPVFGAFIEAMRQ